jgi:hypothetical protein
MLETENKCEFCDKVFKKATTLGSHICPTKNRWLARSHKNSIIGFEAWKQFYASGFASKVRTYDDFIRSPFYNAFSRFGTYCIDINALNIPRYVDWLLKEQKKIDDWCKDTIYNSFLVSYLKTEDPMDALARSIETTIKLSEPENTPAGDYLRLKNPNKICQEIVKGKISPWFLYQSNSGVEFLSNLNQDQERLILPYIAPEQWAIKFMRDKELTAQIKEILSFAGY